jgi:hypothetical protein
MMLAFDMPIPSQPVGCRNVSNVPAQALILMNDPFVKQQAERWAQRMLREVPDSAAERVRRMYVLAYGRGPDESELIASLEFLQSQATMLGVPGDRWQHDARVWADLAHVLWNVKEFIYID